MSRAMKLELGCGMSPTPGYVHHDRIRHSPHVDVAWDLRVYPWPLSLYWIGEEGRIESWGRAMLEGVPQKDCDRRVSDGFLDEILALDVFEHLSVDVQPWLDECWRLLKPDGLLDFRVPAWDHELSYRDPTHLRVFHQDFLLYWDKRHELCRRFGSIYFAESDKWWKFESVERENNDFRFRARKVVD